MIRNYKRDFMSGDAANLSIGQGTLLVTPLQVAHMMSGVANGYLPRLQLIKQIQDGNANVIYAPKPQEVQRPLPAYERALSSVRKGMREVIEGGTAAAPACPIPASPANPARPSGDRNGKTSAWRGSPALCPVTIPASPMWFCMKAAPTNGWAGRRRRPHREGIL